MAIKYIIIRGQHLLRREKLIIFPPNLSLLVTKKCNLSCTFCYYHGELDLVTTDCSDMTLNVLKKILSSGNISAPARVNFYGGEPFSNSHIFTLINYTFEQGFLPSVITNGTYFPQYIHEIIKSHLLFISLSYYPEVTPKLEKSIREIAKYKIINMSYIITEQRLANLESVVRFAIRTGCKIITVENLIENSSCKEKALCISQRYIDTKQAIIKKYSKFIIIRWGSVQGECQERITCPDFWIKMVVDAEGKILPCCQYPLTELHGNFFIGNAFNSRELIRLRHLMANNKIPRYCQGCHYLSPKKSLYNLD